MEEQYKYYAFISYNSAEEKWAKWLQHNLEYYHVPSILCNEYPELPKKIRPVFWYKQDLSGTKLKEALSKELRSSKYLIVICSPHSAKSDWVNDEVASFIEQGKSDRIIPFIVGGTPHAGNPEEECFPPALLGLKRDDEIRGIDVRRKEGKSHALVDVIATMFGIRFDELWGRHQKRKRRMFLLSIFSAIAIMLILAAWRISVKNELITQAKFIAAEAEKLAEEGDVYNAAKLMTHIFRHNKYALKNVDCRGNVFKSVCEIASKQVHSKLLKGVTNAKYNEDGKYILAHSDSIVKIWSVNSMSVVWEKICNNKDEKITNVEFIPGGGYIAIEYKKLNGIKIIELYSFGDDSCKLYKRFDNCNVVFSPDGKSALVRTVYPSDSSRLWSITNDKWIIDAPIKGNAGFSPLGKYVKSEITNCFSIYSAINGNIILSIDSVSNFCFSPDEKYILCGKRDNTIELWSIDSCKCTQTLEDIGYLSIESISYSPHGNYVSISTKGCKGSKLYSFKDGELKEVRTNFYSGKLKFDPKGELALVYSNSSTELRSLTNDSIIWSFDDTNRIDRAEFSNDGNYLLMYSRSSIILYSISDEKMILHNDDCRELSKARFSPRGKYVYTESLSQDIMYENIMSVNDGKVVCSHNITGYRNLSGTNVSFEPNDDCIIICDKSGCFMYELNENKLVSGYDNEIKNPFGNNKRIELAKITPDGKYLYAVSDERIAVWSFEKWEWLTKPKYIGDVKSIDFDVAGENMIVMKGNRAYLRSLKDPKREYTLGNISTNSVVFSNDGKYVLTASNDSTAKIWLVEDGNCIGTMKHGGIVNSAVFSNDGKHILTASNDRTAKLWSIDTIGKVGLEKTYIHDHVVDTAIFSLNDKYIATVSGGKHIETRTIDGKSLGRTRPLGENINCVSFDKYGNVMASYGDDSCAYKKIRGKKLYGRKDSIRFAKFTQDGNYLIRIKCNGNRYYDYLLSVMKVSKYKYVSCTAKYQVPYSNMLDVYYHKDGLYAIVKGKDSPNNEFMKIINISFIESVLNKWSETLGPDAELTKEEKAKYFLN